jgi:carbon monoxide dehydrogenase subunit G
MDMSGEHRIAAPRDAVWAALNDPEVLRACIPGCEELTRGSDTEFTARVRQKIGPVSARFEGAVLLSNIDAPVSYTISGEGNGGVAGFAKGGANVTLDEDGGDTILRYEVHATVGGKLARMGSRLIDSAARNFAGQFFDNFQARLGVSEAREAS